MKRTGWSVSGMCLTLLMIGAGGCATHNPNIEPRANDALRRMSDLFAGAQAFRLTCTATMEEPLENGQLVQFGRNAQILIRQPDCMYAEVHNGPEWYKVWYQGKEMTILDLRSNRYACVGVPGRLDKMLDFMAEKYNIVFPLSDLLFPDPYRTMTEKVESGTYVDEQQVGEHRCSHLLFTQQNVDWQIWIDAGGKAVPRKIVITYKSDPAEPQYEAVLDDWQLATSVDADFTPEVPTTALRVDIQDLLDKE